MNNLYKKILSTSIFACCLISNVGFTLEVTVINPGPNVKPVNVTKVERSYPMATAGDIFCGVSHHMVRFRLGANHAGLPFSITAKKMTRVRVRWDHPDKVYFPFAEKRKIIVFPHSGGLSRLYFRAHQPISGNVYVINDNDVVIKSCPYSFLPAKRVRQSVSFDVGKSEHVSSIDSDDSENRNVSINYRMSSKSAVPEGGYWSWGVGISQTENVSSTRRANGRFSYNW